MSGTEDNNSMQTHNQQNDGGFCNYLLSSLELLRRTNTMSKLQFCSITHNSSELSVHPSAGLRLLLVPFNSFWSYTLPFSFHPSIYFCPTVPELVPNVYPAIMCLAPCPHPVLLFPSSTLSQPFQFIVLILPHFPIPSAPNPSV